jgi:uncharacterized protein YhbP (UPF0306 family)
MIAIKCTYTTTINHSANDINQSLNEILAANKLLSMATVTPQNNSWINTAYYAYDNFLNIYIVTYPSAQHSKNAEYNSTCAISIFDSHHESGPKRGVQLFGAIEKQRVRRSGTVQKYIKTDTSGSKKE